jgi:vacuolar protein sorting-associated protein 72
MSIGYDATLADEQEKTSDSENEDEVPVESLVSGRQKRSTAGNRLSNLIEQEADDELQLLFEEAEDDVEFEGDDGEDASDVQMDSSSDEDDQGPTAGADDLDGERELERQARAERQAKKRKAKDAYFKPALLRKRVKIDQSPSTDQGTPGPRTKKKSERASWIPRVDEGPTRQSSRKATKDNKQRIHARLKEREALRERQVEVMKKAEERRLANARPPMTQADRMKEAARTEKLNSKSLNRWEEMEKRREEERRAKIAALHNRKMDGPYITWWSGPSKYVNGKLVAVGKKALIEDVTEKHDRNQVVGEGTSAAHPDAVLKSPKEAKVDGAMESRQTQQTQQTQQPEEATKPQEVTQSMPTQPPEPSKESPAVQISAPSMSASAPSAPLTSAPPTPFAPLMSAPAPSVSATSAPLASAPLASTSLVSAPSLSELAPSKPKEKAPLDGAHSHASIPETINPPQVLPTPQQERPPSPVPPQAPVVERSAHNVIILENFDPTNIRFLDTQRRILFKRKIFKQQSMSDPLKPYFFFSCLSYVDFDQC